MVATLDQILSIRSALRSAWPKGLFKSTRCRAQWYDTDGSNSLRFVEKIVRRASNAAQKNDLAQNQVLFNHILGPEEENKFQLHGWHEPEICADLERRERKVESHFVRNILGNKQQ